MLCFVSDGITGGELSGDGIHLKSFVLGRSRRCHFRMAFGSDNLWINIARTWAIFGRKATARRLPE